MAGNDYYQRKVNETKRSSKKVKNYVTTNIHDVPKRRKIDQLNNNDYDGVIGQVNLNDYEGVNNFGGTNLNDYEGLDESNFGVVPEKETAVDDEVGLQENVLHKFATYNTIFTLSGISEEELKSHGYLYNPVHDIIARSGGIGDPMISEGKYKAAQDRIRAEEEFYSSQEARKFKINKTFNEAYDPKASVNILSQGLDLFFENFNMLSTVGPNSDRGLSNITKMNFELVEPFSVSLIEKVKAATFINGYMDFMDAPLLLTIEFKGTDENGKQITSEDKNYVRKIPILIVRVEFDLDQAGAKYQVIAVPFGDLAHDDRFKFPRTQLTTSVNSVGEWIKEIVEQLDADQQKEIDEGVRQYKDTYEFVVSEEVSKRAKYAKTLQTITAESNASLFQKFWNNYIAGEKTKIDTAPKIKLAEAQVDGQTSLVKYFEDAIRTGEGYSAIADTFWQYWHMQMTSSAVSPVQTRTGPETGTNETSYDDLMKFYSSSQFRDKAKDNQWIPWFEIKVMVETPNPRLIDSIRKVSPKKVVFKAIPKKLHCLKFFPPGVSLGFMDWSKWVRKQYNFIYTGENVDIQNFRINYKTAYYLRNVRPFNDEHKSKGKYEEFQENLVKVFGSDSSDIRIEPTNQKGKNTMNSGSNKSQQFYDYITNPEVDMIRIELEILGDPAFICQDQFITIHKDRSKRADGLGSGVISKKYGSFNSENFQPLIQVKFNRPPDDLDDTYTGAYEYHYASGKITTNQFAGIYQVVKVDSKFSDGQFLQTLHCVRLNQQQQGNAAAAIEQQISKDYKEENTKPTKTLGGEKNKDRWNKMSDYSDKFSIGEAVTKLQKKVVDKVKKLQEETKNRDDDYMP
tara:strand:- start:6003 stop:8555 length:2553 start_codon:yes stop_codon:yes gene_type:complete